MKKGFSLIEILIVAGVIGLLTLILFSTVNTTRAKTRDAKRLSDVAQIQIALDLYQKEEGSYPSIEKYLALGKWNVDKLCDSASGGFVANGVECQIEYINLPSDPLTQRDYLLVSSQDGYNLYFQTEQKTRLGPAGNYFAHSGKVIDSQEIIK